MPLTDDELTFMEECVCRVKENCYVLDCLSVSERLRLLALLDKVVSEMDIPGSTYGRG